MKKLFIFYSLCVMPVPLIMGVAALFGLYAVHINGKMTTGVYPFVVMMLMIPALGFVMAGVNWLYLKLRAKH